LASHGARNLISTAFSCTRVRNATHTKRHCGRCSQCVDRRFAVLANQLGNYEPPEQYAIDLFAGARKPGRDLTFIESYVLTAQKFAESSEIAFAAKYGEVFRVLPYLPGAASENLTRLHQLHAQHGRAVVEVINRELAARASVEAIFALPESSLLTMVQSIRAKQPVELDPVETRPSASEQATAIRIGPADRPLQFALDRPNERVVFSGGAELRNSEFRIFNALCMEFFEDRESSLLPEDYRRVSGEKLAQRLETDEQTVRQYVRRLRLSLAKQFLKRCDTRIDAQDVIESGKWQGGYRLNPYLVPQPLTVIEAEQPLVGNQLSHTARRSVTSRPGSH
jgi:hypothetical protein